MKDELDVTAERIARLLDQGEKLPEPVLARLHTARQQALSRHRGTASVFALPAGLQWSVDTPWLSRFVFPLVLVLGIGLASNQWVEKRQAEQQAAKAAEIDAAMLSSDLPLDAYLDRDFYAWVKTTPQ